MNETWVKDYRKKLEWGWFKDVPTAHLFEYLMLRAQSVPKEYRGVQVDSGELTTSLEIIANESGLTVRQVRTGLDKLEKTGEIVRKTTNKFTHIKLVKWGDYQDYTFDVDKQMTNERQTNDKQMTTIKECKNVKNVKNVKNNILFAPSYDSSNAILKLATNKTDDFYYIHLEDIEKYKEYYPALDIEQQLRNMAAWLDANPKNRKTHNGMPRFINNWLSKEQNKTRAYNKKERGGNLLYSE